MGKKYGSKLKCFIEKHSIDCTHHLFDRSCHSVDKACQATGAAPEDFIKSVCLKGENGLVVAIVGGDDKASTKKVAELLDEAVPRIASSEEVMNFTKYPPGGVPPFGYGAVFFIDEKVMSKNMVWAGGGSENSLIRISPQEILKVTGARVGKISK
ncbi:MAG: aminoacyl-tRNA deacylase [Candidatus Methanofastidiosia archaeon]